MRCSPLITLTTHRHLRRRRLLHSRTALSIRAQTRATRAQHATQLHGELGVLRRRDRRQVRDRRAPGGRGSWAGKNHLRHAHGERARVHASRRRGHCAGCDRCDAGETSPICRGGVLEGEHCVGARACDHWCMVSTRRGSRDDDAHQGAGRHPGT